MTPETAGARRFDAVHSKRTAERKGLALDVGHRAAGQSAHKIVERRPCHQIAKCGEAEETLRDKDAPPAARDSIDHRRGACRHGCRTSTGKVQFLYAQLGLADRTQIEDQGGHSINGQGTFAFLHKHLRWPAPAKRRSTG